MSRLEPKVTVATTTVTARMAPKMADRTGTALRPTPGSSAKRTPVTAEGGRPAREAAVVTREDVNRVARFRVAVGERAEGGQNGHAGEDEHQGQHADADHRPVRTQCHAEEGPHRSEWPQRRETHRDRAGQQRTEQHGTE